MVTRVGIDLGTTNSCVAYIDEFGRPVVCRNAEGKPTTPSVVAIEPDGRAVVGDEAVELGIHRLQPMVAHFKRSMGDPSFLWEAHGKSYSPEDLSAFVLRKLVDDVETALGERPGQAVVTVPAYFRDPERVATRRAIDLAGLEEIQIVNEPTAAAIAFGVGHDETASRVLVYDLGGGTFDVTVLEIGAESKVLGSNGDHHLGGADWDERLAEFFAGRFEEEHGRNPFDDPEALADLLPAIEGTKKRLSSANSARLSVGAHGRRTAYAVERSEFEQSTEDLLARTLSLTDDILEELGLRADQIDDVVLVGGSTRMPAVDQVLTDRFGKPPLRSINPDEAVAMGAAILAEIRHEATADAGRSARPGQLREPSSGQGAAAGLHFRAIQDVTNHRLGMIAVNEAKDAYINVPILPRNEPIPCEAHRPFNFVFRNPDDELEVFVTQGESSDPFSVAYVGRYVVGALPGTEFRKSSVIEIAYHYDESGVVSVRARQRGQQEWALVEQQPLPDDVPARFSEPPAPEVIREHLNVVIFIDVSGSMDGDPLQKAKDAARRFLEESDLTCTSVGIGVVSDKVDVLLKPSQRTRDIERAIDKIECGSTGYGNEADPFDEIHSLLRRADGVKAGIVLADGVWDNQPRAIKKAKACHKDGIEIVGIGFGSVDKGFIQDISSASDLSVLTSEDRLDEAFSSVAQVLGEKTGMRII